MTRRRGSRRRGSRRRGGSATPLIIKTDSVENYNQSVYTQADEMIKLWAKMRALEMQQSGDNKLELSLKDRTPDVQYVKRVFYKGLADNIAALLKHGLMSTLDEVVFDLWGPKDSRTLVEIANNINEQVTKIPEDAGFEGNFDIKNIFSALSTNQVDEETLKFINSYFQPFIDEARRESAMNLTRWYNDETPSPYNETNSAIWTIIEKDLLMQQKLLIVWLHVLHERRLIIDKMIERVSKKLSPEKLQLANDAANTYFNKIMEDGDQLNTLNDYYSGAKQWRSNVLELNGKKIDTESFQVESRRRDGMDINENMVEGITMYKSNRDNRSSRGENGQIAIFRESMSVSIAAKKIQERINENRKKVVQNSLTAYLDSPLTVWMSQFYAKTSMHRLITCTEQRKDNFQCTFHKTEI